MIERIISPNAPTPHGPYCHAVRAGDFLYISGQAAMDPETNQQQKGTAASETRRTLENIRAVLNTAGADFSDVVKCSVFLSDIGDFAEMNAVYAEYFGEHKPARTTVQATLPTLGLKVEVDCIAYKPVAG
jgi:2-iminobutanoate/2-iminopropanoate deaminase